MIYIDRQNAISLLDRVMNERGGNFRYTDDLRDGNLVCAYERNGIPDCGVGLALSLAGVSVEVLARMDSILYEHDSSAIGTEEVQSVLSEEGVIIDDDALHVFAAFQERQDMGD